MKLQYLYQNDQNNTKRSGKGQKRCSELIIAHIDLGTDAL